ncbi:CU044_2847 family protein [Micromonospora tarensis]|uniref:Trypsin-co-occurring domain-containing protein n=1 Tax=Micromonospora tarensis TaxID=2806100 RepID=A0ABS1YE55_9ACTN|nr:CU044_2847 family protein [Micromonospora tarensis]MBM0275491.1 hypothetical protein [Micromonospora tarensis]
MWVDEVSSNVEREVAQRDVQERLADVLPTITRLCSDIGDALGAIKPDHTTVEFGVALTVDASGLAALITKMGAEMNFKITVEWDGSRSSANDRNQ